MVLGCFLVYLLPIGLNVKEKEKRPRSLGSSGLGLCLLGAPGTIRTYDSRIRNPVLYPLSYGGHSNDFNELDTVNV